MPQENPCEADIDCLQRVTQANIIKDPAAKGGGGVLQGTEGKPDHKVI